MPATRQIADMRTVAHTRRVNAMRDGVVQRATTIPAKRGPGSYRRREKHVRPF